MNCFCNNSKLRAGNQNFLFLKHHIDKVERNFTKLKEKNLSVYFNNSGVLNHLAKTLICKCPNDFWI